MKQKIYRIQLLTLFVFSFLNFVFFYFKEKLPDNFYQISSDNNSIGLFSYYLTSILAHVGFYSGLWVFAAFLFFGIIYSFVIGKKRSPSEEILSVLTVSGSLLICYVIFPETLGEGLSTFLVENSSLGGLLTAVVAHVLGIYYLVAPKSFVRRARQVGESTIQLFEGIKKKDFSFRQFSLESLSFKKIVDRFLPVKMSGKGNPVAQRSSVKINVTAPEVKPDMIPEPRSQEDGSEFATDEGIEEDDLQDEDTAEVEERPLGEDESEEADEEFEEVASPFIKATQPFFASDDLIECVSPNERKRAQDPDQDYFDHIGGIIEDKLKEFGINSQIVGVMKGPVVDTFELNLGAGVKVTSVSNRADDVSLALSGAPIRMVYPMKGKTTVGVEVPRNPRDFIYLDEVLRTPDFRESAHNLPIAMGKDAYGRPSVVDLTAMPHMLVAGTTGSGKSVFVNTLLVSLIVKNSPERLKLILIDPKSVELALFQTLPHLIMPTVTDPSMATVALLWAVEEMERRYALLREIGVRNIDGYNKKIKDADGAMLARVKPHFEDDSETFTLPFLVIIVDEVADLMQSKHGKEIETNVSRLAAKARAAGIHLVLATQRPSADVITGVIKANFPTRIAFKVITNTDSRVILDTQGGEKLLGKGDMLFKQGVDLLRVHSSFVDENEIEKLVEKLSCMPVQYSQAAMDYIQSAGQNQISADPTFENEDGDAEDPLFKEAVDTVSRTRQASASWLQRRMNVGYNRAAKLIEAMERKGVVGPANGAKPRQVLVPPPDDLTT